MTAVVVLAAFVGMGVVGVAYGLRSRRMSLNGVLEAWQRPPPTGWVGPAGAQEGPSTADRLGASILGWILDTRWAGHGRVGRLRADLEITGTSPEAFVRGPWYWPGAAPSGPWCSGSSPTVAGLGPPTVAAGLGVVVGIPAVVALSVSSLIRRATDRRRHFRVVIGSFVDLVVLCLAGGVGSTGRSTRHPR